jgi:hypothetical protein
MDDRDRAGFPGMWPLAAETQLSLLIHRLHHMIIFLQRMKEVLKISTGCQALNDILGGGIETKSITEIYGEFR